VNCAKKVAKVPDEPKEPEVEERVRSLFEPAWVARPRLESRVRTGQTPKIMALRVGRIGMRRLQQADKTYRERVIAGGEGAVGGLIMESTVVLIVRRTWGFERTYAVVSGCSYLDLGVGIISRPPV
jgi:hypothetical protein